MPKGKYTVSDIASPPAPQGKYSAADLYTGTSAGLNDPNPPTFSGGEQGQVNLPDEGQVTTIAPPPPERYSTQLLKDLPHGLAQMGMGAAKGATSSMYTADKFLVPFSSSLIPPVVDQSVREWTAPSNSAQRFGKMAEQTGEFMVPGLGEEAATAHLGKFAPLGRIAYQGLTGGAVNKLQGGSFGTGAVVGSAGGALGEGVRSLAPQVAETAIGVRAIDRAARRTPGQMIIDETKGFSPRSVAQQASDKVAGWNAELQTGVNQSGIPVDLIPSRMIAGDAQTEAALRNNPETMKRTEAIANQLKYEGAKVPQTQATPAVIPGFGPAAPPRPAPMASVIPPQVSASRALALKRGVGELKGSWNPAVQNDFADATVGNVYGALDEGINRAFPGADELNQKMSSMIPVSQRAGATDLNASLLQRAIGRFGRHTGALAGGLAGAGVGAKEGGIPGAIVGGLGGIAAQEALASPTTWLLAARAMNRAPVVVRPLAGGILQADRKSLYKPK